MNEEQRRVYESRLEQIRRGGCNHESWVERDIGARGVLFGPVDPPVVGMANDDDGFYVQWFQNRAEVEEFISKLRATADEAWGSAGESNDPPRD